MTEFWKETATAFTALVQKPVMTQLLLKKPPFKYIFDIVFATIEKTKFARGLYSKQQTNIDIYVDSKDKKIEFLTKLIKLIQLMDGVCIQAKPVRIVSGLDPENTNSMLLRMHKLATSGKNSDSFVKKIVGDKFDQNMKQAQISNPEVTQQKNNDQVERVKLTPLNNASCVNAKAKQLFDEGMSYNWEKKQSNKLAREAFQKAIDCNPKYDEAYFNIGVCHQIQFQNEAALQVYKKVIQLNPKHKHVYGNIVNAYITIEKYDKALEYIKKILQDSPNDQMAYFNQGVVYENLKRYKESVKAYQKVIQLNPNYDTAYQGMGLVYTYLEQPQRAKQALLKAIKINPKDAKSYNSLGIIYQRQKNLEKAEQFFRQAVKSQNHPLHMTNLGNIYLKLKRFQEAFKEFQQVQKILDSPKAKQAKFKFQQSLSEGGLDYMMSSLRIFRKLHSQISNLKKDYKQNKKASKILQQEENKAYEPIIKLLQKSNKQSENSKEFQNNLKNASNQIENQMKKLKERLDKLQQENTSLQLKVQVIQQKMTTKEQLAQIYGQLEKQGKQSSKFQAKIKQFQSKLAPQKDLQSKMSELTKQKQFKFLKYAQSLYWILNSHITSYRMLSLGLVAKGDQIQEGRVGGVVKKISSFLSFAQSAPIVGSACSFINSVAKIYVDQSQNVIISEIANKFSAQWNQRLVSDAISQVVLLILNSLLYCRKIQTVQKENEETIFDFFDIFEQQKTKVINLIEGIQDRPKQVQLELALVDCSYIISQLVRISKYQIKKLQKQRNSENVLLIAVERLLKERQKQQKQRMKGKTQKVETSCQNCQIM